MNSYPLNATVIGNGTADSRVFLFFSTAATATSSMVLKAYRYLTGNVTAVATSVFGLKGRIQLSGSTTGRASGVITFGTYTAGYLFGSALGSAASTINLVAKRPLTMAAMPTATTTCYLTQGRALTGATTGRVTTSMNLTEAATAAVDERVMRMASDNRKMQVA